MLLAFGGGVFDYFDNRAFNTNSKVSLVHPIDEYTKTTKTKRGEIDSVSYSTNITFETETGQIVTVKKNTSADTLNRIIKKEKVEIIYLENKPSRVRWPGEKGDPAGGIYAGLACLIYLFFTREKN
jgi:hypothetical protein